MICEENRCTGCGACAAICPKQCIEMKPNQDGFYIPYVDSEKCVECFLCRDRCPVNNTASLSNEYISKAFSFIHPDLKILMESSSGGAFMMLARYVLGESGCVFGAVYDDDFSVVEVGCDSLDGLSDMQGSKYAECYSGDSYQQVIKLLKEGRYVLYTGTPCRIAGLYAVLGNKRYENLFTAEIICHGVPSAKLFKEYISYLNDKYGRINAYSFRDKSKWGWGAWGSFEYTTKQAKKKTKYFPVGSDYYYSLFYSDNCFRESCYECKFADINRIADITLGDCWGIENVLPSKKIKNGVSVIVTNSPKGEKLLYKAADGNCLSELDIDWVRKNNGTLVKPTSRPQSRDKLYEIFRDNSFIDTAKKFVKVKRVMPVLARYIPRGFKVKVKKILRSIRK